MTSQERETITMGMEQEIITVGEVAEQLQIKPVYAMAILNKLASAGLFTKEWRYAADRRYKDDQFAIVEEITAMEDAEAKLTYWLEG